MENLETKLNELLVTKAPFQIPEKARKWIADYAWIFALIGLILGVLAFFPLLATIGLVSTFAVAAGAANNVLMAWLSLGALGAYLVVLGISIPKLKQKQMSGWRLSFYSALAFFVYDIVLAFTAITSSNGLSTFLMNIIWLVATLYVLFQIRGQFKGAKSSTQKAK